MPLVQSLRFPLAALLFLALVLLSLHDGARRSEAGHVGTISAMSIDMNPAGIPANTATTLGSRERCQRINENDLQDADETSVDAVQFDVTAEGIPPYSSGAGGIVAFLYLLSYCSANLSVQSASSMWLLAVNPGSGIFEASDQTPDSNYDNQWNGIAVDTGLGTPEQGTGILQRVTISSDAPAASGIHSLTLGDHETTGVLDNSGSFYAPITVNNASVAINTDCPLLASIAVDADPGSTPANTPTSIGSVETCTEIVNDDILNGDEDAVDSVDLDVVVASPGISSPAFGVGGLLSFGYDLNYNGAVAQVTGANLSLMLAANGGSSVFIADNGGTNPSQTFPNASGISSPAATDAGPIPASLESGQGILTRFSFEGLTALPTIAATALTPSGVGLFDISGAPHDINSISGGFIVLNDAPGCSDADGDGVPVAADNCPAVPNVSQANGDTDPLGDACDNCLLVANAVQTNSDTDSFGDACDNCLTISNPSQVNVDADPFGNACDNCPSVANAIQTNSDADSFGDACDNCPANSNQSQANLDADTFGDVCDNCPTVSSPSQANSDGDLMGDACDTDDDNDGVLDSNEVGCGSDSLDPFGRPERVDGAFAGVSDDGDAAIDEALPGGAEAYDCDGDGITGLAEDHVYQPGVQGDQDPCGTFASPGWAADLAGGAFSANRINVADLALYISPVRYFNTNVGTNLGDVRVDIVPGKGLLSNDINIQDLSLIVVLAPSMLNNARAFGGPDCPWPP